MSRFITTVALAFGCAAMTAYAQDTKVKTETKSSGGDVKTVTYAGCVHTGTEARTYILDKVVPVGQATTINPNGTTSTVTTYALVPGEVQVQEHVNHKVEVTGMLIPAGDVKSKTTTTVERDDAKDTKTTEKVETKNAMPQFRVTSIKTLSERCE